MRIANISIERFRGIRESRLACSPQMNVFVGNNGAGKSSVLDAVRILLSWYVARVRNSKGNGESIAETDVRQGDGNSFLRLETHEGVAWQLYKQRKTSRREPANKSILADLTSYANQLVEQGGDLPVVAYYGVNRAVSEVPLRISKTHKMEPLDVYECALDGNASFRSFFGWFREREDEENEAYRQHGDNGTFKPDVQLQAVREALRTVFPGYGDFRVRRNPRAFVMEKDGRAFDFRQLSDGEKCYITLVADIARKLAMSHPHASAPLQEGGIVLIDEIDLHLHPQWQSDVLIKLCEVFPQCQFFVTTHSPYVASSVDNETGKLFLLENGEIRESDAQAYGKRVEEVLPAYFGMALRNRQVQADYDRLWQLIDHGDFDSAEYKEIYNRLVSRLSKSDILFAQVAQERKLRELEHASHQ